MSAKLQRDDAESLFAYARRILSGTEEPAPAPADPIDIRSGIDRALRLSRRVPTGPTTLEETAARAVATVEGTLVAIDSIHDYLGEALDLTASALSTPDATKRAMIADRYEELRTRIDTVAAGATFEGVNLIDGGRVAIEIKLPAAQGTPPMVPPQLVAVMVRGEPATTIELGSVATAPTSVTGFDAV